MAKKKPDPPRTRKPPEPKAQPGIFRQIIDSVREGMLVAKIISPIAESTDFRVKLSASTAGISGQTGGAFTPMSVALPSKLFHSVHNALHFLVSCFIEPSACQFRL